MRIARAPIAGVFALSLAPLPAQAQSAWSSPTLDNLGEQGQIVFGVDRVMGISWDSIEEEDEQVDFDPVTGRTTRVKVTETWKTTRLRLFGSSAFGNPFIPSTNVPRLAVDFFVAEGLSLGGSFSYVSDALTRERTGRGGGTDVTIRSILFHPRLGYAAPIDETFSIWPRAGVTYVSVTIEDDDGDESSIRTWAVTGELMFGISPMSHFAILVGPFVDYGFGGEVEQERTISGGAGAPSVTETVTEDIKMRTYGLAVSIVGYY
jgi:hypothetical protein